MLPHSKSQPRCSRVFPLSPHRRPYQAAIIYGSEIAKVDKGRKRCDEVSYCSEEAYPARQCLFVISK